MEVAELLATDVRTWSLPSEVLGVWRSCYKPASKRWLGRLRLTATKPVPTFCSHKLQGLVCVLLLWFTTNDLWIGSRLTGNILCPLVACTRRPPGSWDFKSWYKAPDVIHSRSTGKVAFLLCPRDDSWPSCDLHIPVVMACGRHESWWLRSMWSVGAPG